MIDKELEQKWSALVSFVIFTIGAAVGVTASPGTASAQARFNVAHAFAIPGPVSPDNALMQATDGNFYGTTLRGASDGGTIFKMTPAGVVTVVHSFVGGATDGLWPRGGLIQASDGNLYGTTDAGGATNHGTLFKMTLAGTVSLLYSFQYSSQGILSDGSPNTGVIEGADGNFYGTSIAIPGPFGYGSTGSIFKVTPSGTFTRLHVFEEFVPYPYPGHWTGRNPNSRPIQASDGNFYGTTDGGSTGGGTVYRMTPDGGVTTLHSFVGPGGFDPVAGLVQGTDGSLYGTTCFGGGTESLGTVFKMTLAGTLTTLYAFDGSLGRYPAAALVEGADGNLYGSTAQGGPAGAGTLFKITPSGDIALLHALSSADGISNAALVRASDGLVYGTIVEGGTFSAGAAFTITSDGTFTLLKSFDAGADGGRPSAPLILGADGNLYGTSRIGGASDYGAAFKVTPSGIVTVLHAFDGHDGAYPSTALMQASDGNFYGASGGTNKLYRLAPDGTFTVLYQMNSGNGSSASALIQATDGNFYGTAREAGPNTEWGTIFKMTPSGEFTRLHAFAGEAGGAHPYAALVQGTDGNFYGTTKGGGLADCGTVFTITAAGTFSVLHMLDGFTGEGCQPYGPLLQASDGDFYGTTYYGGAPGGIGAVFRITPTGTFTIVHAFTGTDGAHPYSGLVQSADGSFYGTTYDGGAYGYGTVFRMSPSGTVTVLHSFTGADGANPYAGLTLMPGGEFYGTTYAGGAFGMGEVFTFTPSPIAADFDGDWKADLTVYRASTGGWYTLNSSTNYTTSDAHAWGLSTDTPVPGDYDGDGKVDPAVFRPSTGGWHILKSSTDYATSFSVSWGLGTDVPVPGDYDGDGKTDPAIYRPSTGLWAILKSSVDYSSGMYVFWGLSTDQPMPGDYDGDGKIDPAIYRPSTGLWAILKSSVQYGSGIYVFLGLSADLAVPGDYDGDGKIDPTVFRPSTGAWHSLKSSTSYATLSSVSWGLSTDVPVPADFDGDGKTDPAVFRPSNGGWYILTSSTNYSTSIRLSWGLGTDTPVNRRP